jgi:TonB family protein
MITCVRAAMRIDVHRCALCVALLGMVAAPDAVARAGAPQVATGEVAGRAVDQLDNVLPAVEVSLITARGQRRSTTTDAQGDFTFSNVPAGRHTVFAQLPGFRDFNIGVDVLGGATSSIRVAMAVGMIEEHVTVVSNAEPRPPISRPRNLVDTAAPAVNTDAVRVGGNIRPPRMAARVWPVYPPAAASNEVEGIVVLAGVIASDGVMSNLHVLSSQNPDLSQAAVDAVEQWEFDPTLLDGIPIETLIQVTVEFQLSQ